MVNQLIDGGGGGSTVTYTQTLSSGTKTGEISIDGVSTNMYAPTPPTKVSDLQNDSGFIDNTVNNLTNYYLKSQTYTQAEVDALISAIVTLNILVVQTLPTQDISTTTIYLVPKQTPETQDIYDEYIYVNNAWEHIGTTEIDLSNYYTKSQTDSLLADKVDKVSGKQLSTEDFTSALKTKLDGIASGAEVNVQSDWSQNDNSADDYIKNKPTKLSDFQNDSGFITGVDIDDIGDVDLTNLANGQVLKYNSTTQKWENEDESSGGHVIVDQSGNALAQEPNMTFVDAHLSDNSTDDTTEIEVIKSVTEQQWESATEDGLYDVDIQGAEIEPASDEKVEVTASGTEKWGAFANRLFAEIDTTKIQEGSYLTITTSSVISILPFVRIANGKYCFSQYRLTDANTEDAVTIWLADSDSKYYGLQNGTITDYTTYGQPLNGTKLTLYYGNKSAVIDLQTTSNRCLRPNGQTVEQGLKGVFIGSVSANGGEITVDISNYTEFTVIGLVNGNIPMNSMTTYFPTSNNYLTTYQDSTYRYQIRFKHANGKFTFFQEVLSGWSNLNVALYAR